MKVKIISTLIGIYFFSSSVAQDGSNIMYYDFEKLDTSFIGEYCHIDFGRLSFAGHVIDTIEINVKGQTMTFYEHREDDGYTNSFSEQYLIRVSSEEHFTTRLQNSQIDSLTADKIYVTSTLSYYHYESPIDTITIIHHCYDKGNIFKILVKNER